MCCQQPPEWEQDRTGCRLLGCTVCLILLCCLLIVGSVEREQPRNSVTVANTPRAYYQQLDTEKYAPITAEAR
jgi:hypothetical protein